MTSAPQVLHDIPTNRLQAATIQAGRRCLVGTDHGAVDDAIVVAVWEEGPED